MNMHEIDGDGAALSSVMTVVRVYLKCIEKITGSRPMLVSIVNVATVALNVALATGDKGGIEIATASYMNTVGRVLESHSMFKLRDQALASGKHQYAMVVTALIALVFSPRPSDELCGLVNRLEHCWANMRSADNDALISVVVESGILKIDYAAMFGDMINNQMEAIAQSCGRH